MPDGINFDPSAFLKGLDLADQRVRRGALRGMAKLLADGERRMKQAVPVETGTLAGTCVGDLQGIKADDQAVTGELTAGGGEASDYAVVQHEEPMQHTTPYEGVYAAKYVEGPLKELAPIAAGVLADEIKGELG